MAWGGLDVARVSDMGKGERGGHAVIVLHGWGAPGDDLVPLAEALRRPGVRFFVPAGPLPEMGGGRAWWDLDPNTRPPHAGSDELPPGIQPTAAVSAARTAVQGLIASVVDRYPAAVTASVGGDSLDAQELIDVTCAARGADSAAPPIRLVRGSEARLGYPEGRRAGSPSLPPVPVWLVLSSCGPQLRVRSRHDVRPECRRQPAQPYPSDFDLSSFESLDGCLDRWQQIDRRRCRCYTSTRARSAASANVFPRIPASPRFLARIYAPDGSHVFRHNRRNPVQLLSAVESSEIGRTLVPSVVQPT